MRRQSRLRFTLGSSGKTRNRVYFALNFLRLTPHDRQGIHLAQADALRLPFRGGTFDAVICSETVEHIDDDRGEIQEIARILKPSGLLFFTVTYVVERSTHHRYGEEARSDGPPDGRHVREYAPSAVRTLLSSHFTIEAWYPVGCGWTGRMGKRIQYLIQIGVSPPLFEIRSGGRPESSLNSQRDDHRRRATRDHMPSTSSNGHVPARNPYAELSVQVPAKASTYQCERSSRA